MKKLALLLLLLPSVVFADELLPDGCYVAFNNLDYCYVPSPGTLIWHQSGGQAALAPRYGLAVAMIIENGAEFETKYNQCALDANTLLSQRDANANSVGQWQAYAASLEAANKKAKALEKKLRKACGSKCKKIK